MRTKKIDNTHENSVSTSEVTMSQCEVNTLTQATQKNNRNKFSEVSAMKKQNSVRHIVHLSDTPLTAIDLVRLFPDAMYNASRNAYSVGNTLFVMPKFTLDSDDTQGTD
jgi:hypothetical protein